MQAKEINEEHAHAQALDWWRTAVIYQVYPRSLKDSNGDGIGDLPGVIDSLDYIGALGADAIWISPFFKSPMKDFGYDVSDYRSIDPVFGNMGDFEKLVHEAHQRGIKIIIDQILSHTSDQHPWFIESKSSRDNPKADWYVWADPLDDGSPPNNWLSIFGGCAWQWSPQRKQYYLHNFLSEQPDLNFHNPQVRQQMLNEVEFWLKKGVDGLRLDAINFCFHDKFLRNNPPKPEAERKARGFSTDNPYAWQYHYYNNTQAEMIPFLETLRQLLDRYPGTTSLGEISSEDSLQTMAEYTQGNKGLHMAYSFELLVEHFSCSHIREVVEAARDKLQDGRACWALGNHDVRRVVSRWAEGKDAKQFAKLLSALLATLPGSFCLYQGEELGLGEAHIAKDDIQDPYGLAFWPEFRGRDGCRTPLPWNSENQHGGFSEQRPWLPLAEEHLALAVNKQAGNAQSVLEFTRRLLAWRKNNLDQIRLPLCFQANTEESLVFNREGPDGRLFCAFNFSEAPVKVNVAGTINLHEISLGSHEILVSEDAKESTVLLAPLSSFVANIT